MLKASKIRAVALRYPNKQKAKQHLSGVSVTGKAETIDPENKERVLLVKEDATEVYRLLNVVGAVSIKGISEQDSGDVVTATDDVDGTRHNFQSAGWDSEQSKHFGSRVQSVEECLRDAHLDHVN
ncbi:hypothetical protein TNCV_3487501 [Trichonephila clavipes]|nr:hypothetical protein TNCV_3487501 [Trichonephila clavipes]